MNRTIRLYRTIVNFGIPLCLLGVLAFLSQSTIFAENSTLNLALSIDLLLVVPLVYFLLIRKTEIPKTTVVPVMIIGLLIGSYFLPAENQTYLELFKTWALPVIELSIMTYVILKVHGAIKTYKGLKGITLDFFTTVKNTCSEILPKKLVVPFATEVAVFYYGFIHWKTKPLDENEFTYHKNSVIPSLLIALILIIAVETVAIHFLLARWSIMGAWILTGLSIYTALQVFGFTKSLSKRPISIHANRLSLKYGLLSEVDILFSDIDKIELSTKALDEDELTKTLSPLGEIEGHNVVIYVKKETDLTGLYGLKKKFKVIALYMDRPSEFKEKMREILNKHSE